MNVRRNVSQNFIITLSLVMTAL